MIPKREIDVDIQLTEIAYSGLTYKLSDRKIQGKVDGLQSLEQAIYKVLSTEKYEYPIYSFNYGIELENLIGKDVIYAKVELKRRISECLMQDNRIISLNNFEISTSEDNLLCSFDVTSVYGMVKISKEVNI